jgi:hypothetical protein
MNLHIKCLFLDRERKKENILLKLKKTATDLLFYIKWPFDVGVCHTWSEI